MLYPAVGDRPTPATELRLLGLLYAARDAGYPIKVALVANEQDLTDDLSMLQRRRTTPSTWWHSWACPAPRPCS